MNPLVAPLNKIIKIVSWVIARQVKLRGSRTKTSQDAQGIEMDVGMAAGRCATFIFELRSGRARIEWA